MRQISKRLLPKRQTVCLCEWLVRQVSWCFIFQLHATLPERHALHAGHALQSSRRILLHKDRHCVDFTFKCIQALTAGACRRVANCSALRSGAVCRKRVWCTGCASS